MSGFRDFGLPWLAVLLLLATVQSAPAQSSAVLIHDISPRALVPGSVTRVTIRGAALETARTLWTSIPSTVTRVKAEGDGATQATFDVRLPAGRVGRAAIRVVADAGLSNVALVLLDALTSLDASRVPADGLVSGPSAIEGRLAVASTDRYSIRLAKGQRLTVDAWSRRLGSSLDPVIRVSGPDGQSLGSVDDSPGLDGDALLSVEALTEGLHTVSITDVSRRGGAAYRYRLRLGHFLPVWLAYPFRVKSGQANRLQLLGPGVSHELTLPASTPAGTTWVGGPAGSGGGRSLLSVEVVAGDVLVEREPNDRREQSLELPAGERVSGRFEKSGDRDWYRVSLKKGRRLQVVGHTASLGLAGRLYMRLVDAEGQMLVEVSPAVSTRTTLEHTTGSDMSAWLMVEELQRRGGLSFGYQLDCRFVDPGFSLSAGHERLHAKPGGKVSLKVTAVRRNFTGAIRLGVEGLGPDVELAGAEIVAGKNETLLTISLPKNLKPAAVAAVGGLIGLKIVGEGLLEPPAEGVTVVERSSLEYSRGDLGKFDGFISDNKGGLNYAEYDVELPEAGEYLVLLKYAALAARVASMKLNGKVVGGGIMTRTTGSWNVNTARWFNEGLVKFPRGKSVLRLEKNGVFSHLTTIRIARPAPKSKDPAKTVRASASTLNALRSGLGGMTFVPSELDGTVFLSVGQ